MSNLIRDAYPKEVLAIGKYIYGKLQDKDTRKNAIKAWDNFEKIADSNINDIKNLNRFLELINNHSEEFGIDIKNKRYIMNK